MEANLPPAPAAASAGLSDNQAGALAYITVLPAIVFLILEPYSKRPFVRQSALQCIALALSITVLSFFLIIPVLGWILVPIADLVVLVLWVMCAVNAYQGRIYKLPLVGDKIAEMANQ